VVQKYMTSPNPIVQPTELVASQSVNSTLVTVSRKLREKASEISLVNPLLGLLNPLGLLSFDLH
jgi:hypothetical protein